MADAISKINNPKRNDLISIAAAAPGSRQKAVSLHTQI
jgi:hypothetical protein